LAFPEDNQSSLDFEEIAYPNTPQNFARPRRKLHDGENSGYSDEEKIELSKQLI
jgi:hypothetical protein